MIKNKTTNLGILIIYLLTIAQVAKRTILSSALEYTPWSYSELLISYPDKFLRRGFIGEVINVIDSDGILFDTVNLVLFINFFLFILLSFANIKISNLEPIQHFLFLISIFGIFNITTFNQYYHRKEMFVLNLFFLITLIFRTKINTYLILFVTSICSILMILIHEGIAMITIPFIVFILKSKNISKSMVRSYTVIIFISFLLVIFNSGGVAESDAIWSSLSEFDKSIITLQTNAITAMGWSLLDSFLKTTQVLIFSGSMFLWSFYLLIFAYTFIVIFDFNLKQIIEIFEKIRIFIMREKYFLVIPILFIVGFDWGRWFFSLFHLTFFTYLLMNKNNISKIKHWNLSILLFITISSLTIMPECCLQMDGTTVSSNYYRILKSVQLTLLDLIN